MIGNEAVEDDALVFQPLRFMDREQHGVAKYFLASAFSSSRMTSTANRVDWRIFWWGSRFVPSLSAIRATLPASPPTDGTRRLLSRSIEPKRRCLIFSNWLATRVALRVRRERFFGQSGKISQGRPIQRNVMMGTKHEQRGTEVKAQVAVAALSGDNIPIWQADQEPSRLGSKILPVPRGRKRT